MDDCQDQDYCRRRYIRHPHENQILPHRHHANHAHHHQHLRGKHLRLLFYLVSLFVGFNSVMTAESPPPLQHSPPPPPAIVEASVVSDLPPLPLPDEPVDVDDEFPARYRRSASAKVGTFIIDNQQWQLIVTVNCDS